MTVREVGRSHWGTQMPDDDAAFLLAYRARPVNTVADTSRFTGISTKTLYEMIQNGDIEVFNAGRRKLVKTRLLLLALGENPSPVAE